MNMLQDHDIDAMGKAELEKLLKQELSADQKDYELVHRILEKLETEADQLPIVSQGEVNRALRILKEPAPLHQKQEKKVRWSKYIASAAAMVCLVLLMLPAVSGVPFIQEMIATWNDDFFWIETPGIPVEPPENYVFQTDHPGLQQLYDAVTELGITEPVVPMWLPEGLELVELSVQNDERERYVYAFFSSDKGSLRFVIDSYVKINKQLQVRDTEEIKDITFAGRSIKIFENMGDHIAMWNISQYGCYFKTDDYAEELDEILYSIYGEVNQ